MKAKLIVEWLIQEAAAGCLMFPLPFDAAKKVVKWSEENIPDKALAEGGRENEIHVTVLYGFKENVTAKQVAKLCKDFAKETGKDQLSLELGKVSRFKNDGYDVLKVDLLEDGDLAELHHYLRDKLKRQVEVTHKVYHAHLTLAYVKPGALKSLDGHGKFCGEVHLSDELVYSAPHSKTKHIVSLTGKVTEELL